MPVGDTRLIVAALSAAAVSSLDFGLNCLGAVGVEEYYGRIRPNASDREKRKMGKRIVAICGLAAIGVASLYVKAGNKTVLGIVFTLYAIFSGGIAGLFLLGLFSRRANKQGLYIGIVASVLFTAYAVLTSTPIGIGENKRLIMDLGGFNFTHHKYMLGVYSHFVLFSVGYLASFFFKSKEIDENLTIYAWIQRRKEDKYRSENA